MSDDNIHSLEAARFNKTREPKDHKPTAALEACREWIRGLEEDPDHIIVLVGRNLDDGSSGTKIFQAGNFSYHAELGLLMEGMLALRESS